MTVDVSKLREGDVVLVRGVFEQAGYVRFHSSSSIATVFLNISSVEPRPLKVGDFVTRREGGRVWTIRAIDAGAVLLAAGRDLDAEFLENLNEAFV